MNSELYLGHRVVLTTRNEVCYAGVPTHELTLYEKEGLLLLIDQSSGLSVWCPEDFIKDILVIPIPEEKET